MQKSIYLDHNATTPLDPAVGLALPSWLEAWGNPSSIHEPGRLAKRLVREARAEIALTLKCDPLELIFTSGGSESNNLALKGLVPIHPERGRNRILISNVEHPSVKRAAEWCGENGYEILTIPVNREGEIDLAEYKKHLSERVALVSVMLANNEIGSVFPVACMAKMAHEVGAYFHTDAVQALGKMPIDVLSLGVDLLTISAHKFYALKGCGALYVRKGLVLKSHIHGGGQERHRRGGTENVLAIAALGEVCKKRELILPQAERLRVLRDAFEAKICSRFTGVKITAPDSVRLPSTSSLVIDGIDGETLLMALDMRGFAVSTGAACSSGSPEPSPVLLAIGLTKAEAQSSLRLGLGWSTTEADMDNFCATLIAVVEHLRSIKTAQFKTAVAKTSEIKASLNVPSHSLPLHVTSQINKQTSSPSQPERFL